ncbi:MAG: hypothetical protein IJP26_05465 [Clostridia bacterium]|nr:hypothetical protein [Clostridia bacterium]
MRKFLCILLTVILLFSVCGCKKNEVEPQPPSEEVIETEGEQENNTQEPESTPENDNNETDNSQTTAPENNSGVSYTSPSGKNFPKVLGIFNRNTLGIEITSDNAEIKAVDTKANAALSKIENYPDTLKASGQTYYIAANGNDSNSGTSASSAKKTYNSVKGVLKSGDVVLFRRGDIFRGQIRLISGVSYGAYGSGIKPRIYGSIDGKEGEWKETDDNIYTYSAQMKNYSNIIFNNGEAVGRPVQKKDELTKNPLNVLYKGGKISVYCPYGNPKQVFDSIEIVDDAYCLVAGNGGDSKNITLQNLCIMYTGVHCVGGLGAAEDFTIEGCVIGFAGGRDLYKGGNPVSLGNAIEFWCEAENVNVHDNYIFQCYDTGISHQGPNSKFNNIRYSDNLIEYCVWGIEAWTSHDTNQVGSNNTYGDVYIENNIIRHSGYGWGSLDRPDKNVYADITYSAADHVKPLKISGNIFDRPRKYSINLNNYPNKSLLILTDNTFLVEPKRTTIFYYSVDRDGCKANNDVNAYINKYYGTVSGNKIISVS